MFIVSSILAVLALAVASSSAAAAVININFSGGGALGSWQEIITRLPGYDYLNDRPTGITTLTGAYGETRITGSLSLDTRNFQNGEIGHPFRFFRGPPEPITHMTATADGPVFPHKLSTADSDIGGYTFLQWQPGIGGRDWFYALAQLRFVETVTEKSSGGNGEPFDYLRHRHFDIKSILLYMDGSDGFVSDVMVDGTLAPFVTGLQGCETCDLDMLELVYDEYHVFQTDAAGEPVADYMFYDNVLSRRSLVNLNYISSSIAAPVVVDEPSMIGIPVLAAAVLIALTHRRPQRIGPPSWFRGRRPQQ